MLTSQRDALFALVNKSGLPPTEFHWETRGEPGIGQDVAVLTHQPSGYAFSFGPTGCAYSPGRERAHEWVPTDTWDAKVRQFMQWLVYLRRELEAPDLWAAMGTAAEALPDLTTPTPSNEPFSVAEKAQLHAALNEVKEYVRVVLESSGERENERLDAVERRLEYLAGALDRQGRADWVHTAVGVFATLALSGIIPPHVAADYFRHAVTTLKAVLPSIRGLPWF